MWSCSRVSSVTELSTWDQLRGTYFCVKHSQSKLACAICIQQETHCYFFSLPLWYQSPRGAGAWVWHAEYGSLAWAYRIVLIILPMLIKGSYMPDTTLQWMSCSISHIFQRFIALADGTSYAEVQQSVNWQLCAWRNPSRIQIFLCYNLSLLHQVTLHTSHAQAQHGACLCIREVFNVNES